MKRTKRVRVAMQDLLCRLTPMVTPGEIKFLYDNESRKTKIFAIRGPITDQDQRFELTNQQWHDRNGIPGAIMYLVNYIDSAKRVMQSARDLQPFNDDLRPWTEEERRKFCVKRGKENLCLPISETWASVRRERLSAKEAFEALKRLNDRP